MVSIDFFNHLKPGALNFSSAFLNTIWRYGAFNTKSENINSKVITKQPNAKMKTLHNMMNVLNR